MGTKGKYKRVCPWCRGAKKLLFKIVGIRICPNCHGTGYGPDGGKNCLGKLKIT